MDLSIFLILISAIFQFIGEYFNWNQTKVKLILFLFILVITLPNIIFMFIDWWQSPHSKIALLVLNTSQPILRGETYRLFRWLKSIGINLACDDLNHLPITKFGSDFEFYMTRECFEQTKEGAVQLEWGVGVLEEDVKNLTYESFIGMTRSTFYLTKYTTDGVFIIHQLRNSRKLEDLFLRLNDDALFSHPFFQSSLMKSASYHVDSSRAQLLNTRLMRLCNTEMPMLASFKQMREWYYFHSASTLDNLNGDLVLIKAHGESIAVGSPQYNIINHLRLMLNRR